VDCVQPAKYRVQWWDLVNMVMKFVEFLDQVNNYPLSRRILLYEIRFHDSLTQAGKH